MTELGGGVARVYAVAVNAAVLRGDDTEAERLVHEYLRAGGLLADLVWEQVRV